MADLSPGARSSASQQSFSRSTRKARPSPSTPLRMKPSHSRPGSTAASRSRSGPSANWKMKSSGQREEQQRVERLLGAALDQQILPGHGEGAPRVRQESVLRVGQVEPLDVLGVEPGPRGVERDAAAGEDGQAVGEAELAAEAVGGHEQRAAAGLERLQPPLQPLARALIEAGEGLVEQQHARGRERRAGPGPAGAACPPRTCARARWRGGRGRRRPARRSACRRRPAGRAAAPRTPGSRGR